MLSRLVAPAGTALVHGATLLPEGGSGLESVRAELLAKVASLSRETPALLLRASTGAGKSKVLPSMLAETFGATFAITPSTADVRSMAAFANVGCRYQVGGEEEAGSPPDKTTLRITTAGLACKKVLGEASFLRTASVILLDEIDVASANSSYATLFEKCMCEARRRPPQHPLRLILTSATPSAAALKLTTTGEALFFEYCGRQFPVETATVQCKDVDAALLDLARQAAGLGHSSLLFCLGEEECERAVGILKEAGVHAEAVHSKLESEEIANALRPKPHTRVLCGTAIAERAITQPDIVLALDPGLSRRRRDVTGVLDFVDVPAPPAVETQRRGRVGRVAPGAYVKAVQSGASAEESAEEEQSTVEEVMQAFAIGMPAQGVRLCRVGETTAAAATLLAKALFSARESCRNAFLRYPLSLANAAALDAAKDPSGWWDVRFEASALASLLETGACKKTTDVQLALQAIEAELPLEIAKDNFRLRRLKAARQLHAEICSRTGVWRRSRLSPAHVEEGLALAFLRSPLQLGLRSKGVAYIAGTAVLTEGPDGPVVLLGTRQLRGGARATFELQVTSWVEQGTHLRVPTAKAASIGDSTVAEMRMPVFFALRQAGYDLVHWKQEGGAWETDIPALCRAAPASDVLLCFPNGNRLACQERASQPAWLHTAARDLVQAASTLGGRVAFFVGDAALSPGVRFPEVYAELVPKFQRALEVAGAVVVGRCPGETPVLQDDGIHWRAAVSVVQALVLDMLERAKPIENGTLEAGWVWRMDADGRHYPFCVRCQKWMNASHLESSKHKQAAGDSMRLYCRSYELGKLMISGTPREVSPEALCASAPTVTPTSTPPTSPTSASESTPSFSQLLPVEPALLPQLPPVGLRPPLPSPPESLRRCAGCLEEKNGGAAFGRAQFAAAWCGGDKCLACAERDRAAEYAICAEASALRTCQRCQQSKAVDGFGKPQFRRASYGEGTCLTCAEEERTATYVEWLRSRE